MVKDIYIFSGLGADERAFKRLDFSGFKPHFIEWETPEKFESLEIYAQRLISQIPDKNPLLMGLSFGGIMAIEVAKQLQARNIILLASAKTKKELPFYYRWTGIIGLQKLMPSKLMMQSNFFTNWLFSISSEADKKLLKEILDDTDPAFFNWAIDKIVNWKNAEPPKKYVHIHGTADRIFPIQFVSCDFEIKNGGHFMTLDKAEEVSSILKEILQKID